MSRVHFEKQVLSHYAPYFHDLKDLTRDLRAAFFAHEMGEQDVQYDEMLEIFQRALDSLPATEVVPVDESGGSGGLPETIEEEYSDQDGCIDSDGDVNETSQVFDGSGGGGSNAPNGDATVQNNSPYSLALPSPWATVPLDHGTTLRSDWSALSSKTLARRSPSPCDDYAPNKRLRSNKDT